MNKNLILKFENLIKSLNKATYYEYLRILHLYKFFIGNIQEFTSEDRLEILSFFYEILLGDSENFYEPLSKKESFIFQGDKFREKNFRLALEYFKNRTVLGLNNKESIDLIEQNNPYYSPSLIEFLKVHSRTIEEIFYFNEQLFRDKLETLVDEKDFYKIYSDHFCDVIVIRKNFFNDINPSFFSREGLIIRFCEEGQIGFEKDSLLLNEKEALISKGIPLGNYKVLTSGVNYVTVHIKDSFLKDFQVDLPNYLFKKLSWRLDKETLKILDDLDSHKNSKIILLRFISDIILNLSEEFKTLDLSVIDNVTLNEITKFIDDNLEEPLSVSILLKKFGVNKNSLNSLFKENFDVSPSKYIINQKLERSSSLLLESKLSVTEIAFRLNFSNTSKFSAYFKKKFSITPLQFKKKFETLAKNS